MGNGGDPVSDSIRALLASLRSTAGAHELATTFDPDPSVGPPGMPDAADLHRAAATSPPLRREPCGAPPGPPPDAATGARLGVVETARAIARGELTAQDAVEASLARISARASLNAFVHVASEGARAQAAVVDAARARGARLAPLAGVPIAHKDILLTRAMPTRAGSALLAGLIPDRDAEVVRLIERSGAICLGKVNTHEFATGVTGTVSAAGPTLNPLDSSRVPGGSSAGSAVAVAAGLIAGATGTDTGGSIRIPAACCGVVGLKPTYGLVSRDGVVPFASTLDHVGPMAGSVEDVEALLWAMCDGRPGGAAPPEVARLRIGVLRGVNEQATEPVCSLVGRAIESLAAAGATVHTVDPPATWYRVPAMSIAIFLAEGGAYHRAALSRWPDLYQPETRAFLSRAGLVSGSDYIAAMVLRRRLVAEMAAILRGVDLIALPTLPCIAPPIGSGEVALPAGDIDVRAALTLFTRAFNLTGLPTLSVPCGAIEGLAAAVQLAGRPFEEATVLQGGRLIEAGLAGSSALSRQVG